MTNNKLNLKDLKIGMEVTTPQLADIKDTYIVLSNVEVIQGI